jgi:RDD family
VSPKQTVQQQVLVGGRAWGGPLPRTPAGPGGRAKALALTVPLLLVTLVVGWLAWSIVEWRAGRTPAYRLTGHRVVRRSDGRPIGFCRSALRELCCLVLLIPTLLACCLLAIVFVMGASPPEGLSSQPRRAPWDVLTATEVMREDGRPRGLADYVLEEDLELRRN